MVEGFLEGWRQAVDFLMAVVIALLGGQIAVNRYHGNRLRNIEKNIVTRKEIDHDNLVIEARIEKQLSDLKKQHSRLEAMLHEQGKEYMASLNRVYEKIDKVAPDLKRDVDRLIQAHFGRLK